MKRPFLIFSIWMVLMAAHAQGAPITEQGKSFDPAFEHKGLSMSLIGVGTLRYMGLFKIYAGALYAPAFWPSTRVLEDVPKRLEVVYLRNVRARDIAKATFELMSEQLDADAFRVLRDRIDQHNSLYVDAGPGDRYALTYIPGTGTELSLNGHPRGTVAGADFAEALFGLWLGPQPMDHKFKEALLGLGANSSKF
jgi:hypothetical protein